MIHTCTCTCTYIDTCMMHDEYLAVVSVLRLCWSVTTSLRCVTKVYIVKCSSERNIILYVGHDAYALSFLIHRL